MISVGPFQLALPELEWEAVIAILLAGLVGLLAGFLLGAGGRGRDRVWVGRFTTLPLLALVLGIAVWSVSVPPLEVGEYPGLDLTLPQAAGELVNTPQDEPPLSILFEPPDEQTVVSPARMSTPISPSQTAAPSNEVSAYGTEMPRAADQGDLSGIWRLVIPNLELDVSVVSKPQANGTWDITGIRERVAWLDGTALPGEGGNTVLAGHITVLGVGRGPFYSIQKLVSGMKIYVYTQENLYIYQVREQYVVNADDGTPALSTPGSQLTLVTCTSWDEKAKIYRKRRILAADLWDIRPLEVEIRQ